MENNRATHTHTVSHTNKHRVGLTSKCWKWAKGSPSIYHIPSEFFKELVERERGFRMILMAFPSTSTHITSANKHTWGHTYTHTHTLLSHLDPTDQPPRDPVEASFPQFGRTLSKIIPHCTRFSFSSACLTVAVCSFRVTMRFFLSCPISESYWSFPIHSRTHLSLFLTFRSLCFSLLNGGNTISSSSHVVVFLPSSP